MLKRLHPYPSEGIKVLERCGEIEISITSDTGSKFINDLLYHYCLDEKITFTCSRPYKKNDQAHVEQKNWSAVRHVVGYDQQESRAFMPTCAYMLISSNPSSNSPAKSVFIPPTPVNGRTGDQVYSITIEVWHSFR